jgi:hypothetical protein
MTNEQLTKALRKIFPKGGFVCSDTYESIQLLEDGMIMPTEQEIALALVVAENEEAAMLYRKQRAKEYPSFGDQLDALWKGGDELLEMQARIQEIKNKYPRGE